MSDIKQFCLDHWGLNTLPFETSADPAFFYESAGHIEALTRLQMVVGNDKTLTLTTGDYGSGKSMLWSTFRSRLDHHRFITGTVVNPRETNRICSMALMAAAMEGKHEINLDLLNNVFKELYR